MVRYREMVPSAPLRSWISTLWILEQDGEEAVPQRVVPDGAAELILNWRMPFEWLQGDVWHPQPRCFFAGQICGPLMLRPGGPARMLGIRFRPEGAARILAPPMHELTARFTAIEDLSPILSRSITAALDSADPVAAVERVLMSAADAGRDREPLVEEAVRRITNANGLSDISRLARDLSVSTRQLERRFQARVGLPPKLFGRIRRFSNVFRVLGEGRPDWVETALACGYYDQAHLIRDCRNLSGHTPAALLADDADLARHFYLRFGVSHSSNTRRRVLR